MSKLAQDLKTHILQGDPYEKFDWRKYPDDISGGEIYPDMKEILDLVKPNFVIEVGTWKGASAIHMADVLAMQGNKDFTILCIDTWLGSIEHYIIDPSNPTWGLSERVFGVPTTYYQFLSNVCRRGLQENIVPFPNTSAIAYQWFVMQESLQADFIFIDADHSEDECYLDIKRWYEMLAPGGVMAGDDFDPAFHGVIAAVNKFSREMHLKFIRTEYRHWMIQKPPIKNS
jgi:predicted O-methyltransferase YrrM